MRSIIHLSDVHFGSIDPETLAPLIRTIHDLRPNLVVVSGDLTQRAKRDQFKEARQFLMSLPGPQIVVPGNHDVPVMNPIARFGRPLARFKHYITPNLFPYYEDEEIAVLGVNTARASTTKYGHISKAQLVTVREKLSSVPDEKIKIIVTHHPFDIPEGYRNTRQIVGKAERAMRVFAECGADVFLAGHLHKVFTSYSAERYSFADRSALIIQAGTATSTKNKYEPNSLNLIECDQQQIVVTRIDYNANSKQFGKGTSESFTHTDKGWTKPVVAA